MTVEPEPYPKRKFRDRGVVELTMEASLPRRQELIKVLMETMEVVRHGSGQVIIAGGITDRQKRHLLVHLRKYHSGVRDRMEIDRVFPYHNGEQLTVGTRLLINGKKETKEAVRPAKKSMKGIKKFTRIHQ